MGYVTEAEAKTKFCPHLKANCIGSGCMAWRIARRSEPAEQHEARELGPWDAETQSETLAMIMAICGVEVAQKLESDPDSKNEDGDFCDSDVSAAIDELLVAHYESKIDAFKEANKPEGTDWEENTSWADRDGMYVEWIKPGPPLGYCGHMLA